MNMHIQATAQFVKGLRSFLPADDQNSLALSRDFIEQHNFRPQGELREEHLACAGAFVLEDADLDDTNPQNR